VPDSARAATGPVTALAGELVDAVIVNWNGGGEVVAAARSAVRFGAHAIVVDNGSEDGSATMVEREVPTATVIRLGYNAGFARASNVGASCCSAPVVLLLNPDAEVVEGSAASLVELFSTPDRPTIVGPTTIGPDGTRERTVRRLPTLTVLILYQLKLHRLARWIAPLRAYFMLDFRGSEPTRVEQVIGAALAVRREDWVRFGGLDEGYFLLFEEVDLCRRVADSGGFALYWPGITVRHIGSTSFRKLTHVQRQRIWNASLLRYARLHLGPAAVPILQLTFPVGLAVGVARDAVDGLIRSRTGRDSTTIRS
jgi:N-acetylglucosaminyl-diphospho-decaprenol L-rhamnosyltransferase